MFGQRPDVLFTYQYTVLYSNVSIDNSKYLLNPINLKKYCLVYIFSWCSNYDKFLPNKSIKNTVLGKKSDISSMQQG